MEASVMVEFVVGVQNLVPEAHQMAERKEYLQELAEG
jgi:hypothetical protein